MLLVRASLQDVAAGKDAAAVAEMARKRSAKVTILVLLDTLTYLQRGGRIGRAQALVGSLLSVKPMLTMKAGEVAPMARVRNQRQGVDRIIAELKARLPLRGVAIFHARVPELIGELRDRVCATTGDAEVLLGRVGPVVGAYTGPGGIGVASLGVD